MYKKFLSLFVILALLSSCIYVLQFVPTVNAQKPSSVTTLFPPSPELVVLYKNGSYFENVTWNSIVWGQVDKVGILRADMGRVGFESEYGCVLWYPSNFDEPIMFIAQRLWGKIGETWHKFYVQGDVAKTPWLTKDSESWTMGWKGTIIYTYNSVNYNFSVSVGVKMPFVTERMYYKTNITTPIALDNVGIEYRLYANPLFLITYKNMLTTLDFITITVQ